MESRLQTIINRILQRQKDQMTFAKTLMTGLFAGTMMVIMTVTYASLIFSGELNAFIGNGVALGLTSVIVIGTILTVLSSSSHLIIQIDDDTAPVFALLLTILAASLPATLTADQLLTNLLAALFAATLLAGVTLTIFGIFKFGNFVQFLPYSVMGGYFAAVGWLLVMGAIAMITNTELMSVAAFKLLFTQELLWQWVPALAIGVWLRAMSSRVSTGLLLGGTVTITIIGFFTLQHFQGNSPQELMDAGRLIGPFSIENQSLLNPVYQLDWSAVEWKATFGTSGSAASITLISLLSMILCISGLSLSTRRELDINHELKIAGLANIASSGFGGMAALPSLSISNLAYEVHPAASRMIGATAICVAIATFYFGMDAVAHLPKLVLGALSIYIGLGFLMDWLVGGYKKFGPLEYSVIPIILIVSIFAGFLQGVVTGVIASIVLFVIKYSRIKVIRYQATGAELRSNLVRDAEQNTVLNRFGDQTRIFTLQGYLFFGTAGSLYRSVLDSIEGEAHQHVKFVILDFSQVIGVDSSATLNFEKLSQRLAERKIFLLSTGLQASVLEILRRGSHDRYGNAFLMQYPDLDRGMEWCENELLRDNKFQESHRRGIFERMEETLPDASDSATLATYLKKQDVVAGQLLASIGDQSDSVFFLESCTASAYIIDSSGKERRVSGAGRGAIYGEIGFFLNIPRTATVRVDSEGAIYVLSHTALGKMEREQPEMAAAVVRYIAQIVTERLVDTTKALRSVL